VEQAVWVQLVSQERLVLAEVQVEQGALVARAELEEQAEWDQRGSPGRRDLEAEQGALEAQEGLVEWDQPG